MECSTISSSETIIHIYIYEDGSSGYTITTKGKNPKIRKVTERTAEVIREIARFGHILHGTDISHYGPIDPNKSNVGRVPTDKQEQTDTDDSLDKLLREMDKLINET